MFKRFMQAVPLAVVALFFSTAAFANGQVENAMQLWLGDLRTEYNKTVDLLGQGKVNDAKEPAAKLQDLTYQMATATYNIQQNANTLAPELGAAWTDTQAQMNELNKAASFLKSQIGVQKPVTDPLKAALASADTALNKSWEFTKTFGKKYGELVGGPIENAKQLFDGAVSDRYETTIEYLEAYNTDRGKVEIDGLKELIARLYELTETAGSNSGALAKRLAELWAPAAQATKDFQAEVGVIQSEVGNQDFDLGNMKSLYADLNADMVRSYKDIMTFGEQFRAICDDWS